MNTANSQKVILVIEDERSLLDAVSTKLEREGFVVLTARTAEEGLDHLESTEVTAVDAIWLDHALLGKKNGLDFLAACRVEGSSCRDIPVFVVTNSGGPEKRQTYLELGATHYYIKADNKLGDIIAEIKAVLTSK